MAKTKIALWMTNGLAVLLVLLMLPGKVLANSGGEGSTVTVGGYQVSLVFSDPVKVGENLFHLQILDGMNMPVSNARVEISALPVEETLQHQESMQATPAASDGMPGMGGVDATQPAATEVVETPAKSMPGMGGMDATQPAATEFVATPANSMPGMGNMDATQPGAELAEPTAGMAGMGNMDATEPAANAPTATPSAGMAPEDSSMANFAIYSDPLVLLPGEEDGEYKGQIVFASEGHWMLTAHIMVNDQDLQADFPLDVRGGSAGGVVLAGYAGLNVLIIGIAAITKRKPVTA